MLQLGGGNSNIVYFYPYLVKSMEFPGSLNRWLAGGNSNIFGIFIPNNGEDEPILTDIFQLAGLKPPTRTVSSKNRQYRIQQLEGQTHRACQDVSGTTNFHSHQFIHENLSTSSSSFPKIMSFFSHHAKQKLVTFTFSFSRTFRSKGASYFPNQKQTLGCLTTSRRYSPWIFREEKLPETNSNVAP